MMLIDSHTHLDSKDFDEDREEVIARALAQGLRYIINIGATDGLEGARRSQALAKQYPFLYYSVGVHPHDAKILHAPEALLPFLTDPKVLAIGETGLDFFRDWCPSEDQYRAFEIQIELAKQCQKPLIIHSRSAGKECYEMLKSRGADTVGGVFHCFGENADFAKKLLDMNFLVSFPGIISYPKAHDLREAAKAIPLDTMMLETDAPYLAPVPFRGKRCESAYLVHTAQAIAELKKLPLELVAETTSQVAIDFYKIPQEKEGAS